MKKGVHLFSHLWDVGVCHLLVRDNINVSHSLVIEWANFLLLCPVKITTIRFTDVSGKDHNSLPHNSLLMLYEVSSPTSCQIVIMVATVQHCVDNGPAIRVN